MLGQREFNASVLMETVQADTIVISASGHDPLPERVASWLELCMTREGRNAPPQIIVLHENGIETDSATLPLCASLKRIATRSGAGFMCLMDSAAPAADEARNRIAKRWAGISEPVAEPGRYPVAEVSRRWGIND